jgi:hypothetical protein
MTQRGQSVKLTDLITGHVCRTGRRHLPLAVFGLVVMEMGSMHDL